MARKEGSQPAEKRIGLDASDIRSAMEAKQSRFLWAATDHTLADVLTKSGAVIDALRGVLDAGVYGLRNGK
eukprot:15454331-Alexandrium_andersonii.AAC.1